MKLMKSLLLLSSLVPGLAGAAQLLPISVEQQQLLGIEVRAVTSVEQGGAGEVALRVAFAADGEWAIKTPMAGVLHRVYVQQGDLVKAGDPLVVVRSADMVALQRDYLKARAELNLQSANWERDQKLGAAGSISDRRRQETRYQYETAKAEYAGLKGQLVLAGYSEADFRRLEASMEIGPDIVLSAPADAVVLSRPAMLGDQLDGSELLVSLGETGKLVLEGRLSKSAAAHLAPGSLLALRGSDARAELTYVSSVIDPQSQTIYVRAQPLDAAELQPGQLTRWNVLSSGALLTVPSSAVVKLDNRDVVYVSVPSGYEAREVEVKSTGSGEWVVMRGLKDGERIAVTGTAALKAMSMGIGGGDE
jgi:cobalt-zinc-cadmium efflux system membrane fusion protein